MTINTQKLREAAASVRAFLKPEYGREISAAADIIEALEGQVAEYARMLEKQSAEAGARIDAQAAEIARLRTENAGLRISLRNMIGAYVRLMENGRDRIIDLGGQCDPVDVMEAADPWLRASRAALAQEQGGSDAA